MELTYHILSLLMALLVFFMKFTAQNSFIQPILVLLGKVIPLFVLLYSGIQIFKHFGVL